MASDPDVSGGEQAEPPDDVDDPDVDEVDPTGRYFRYKEVVGSGAFKTVYKGFDVVEGIEVAWAKVEITGRTMGSPKELQRLKTEIQLLRSLHHKHILKLYASWVDNKKRAVNIITELFTSGNLREYRTKHKKVDMKAMRRWAKQILTGLAYLHSQKPPIIHRDLKCDNIFINGNHGKVKIGDFGLAMVMQQRKTQSIQGTLEFMAPELFGENYNELVDIYSFGMCMLEMVTGECPYSECQGFVQIYKKISEGVKPVALSKVKDAEVRSFIESCLASAADRLPATFPPNLDLDLEATPIFISLLPNGTVDNGKGSFSLVLRRGGFVLEGDMSGSNPVNLLLRIPVPNGKCKNIEFAFDLENDTSLLVATEMVQELELPSWSMPIVAKLVDAFLLKTVRGWRPCVQVGQMIQAVQNTASVNGKSI
ncbi:serine/threonine-protein kinase WNK4 isoform X4 [Zea mays]|uniref:non-specific serine/threonine protein kinase n=1 Tax=Zea mays TaxID=4577 RepID=A0A804P1M3_MAIZE|nr:serine/threonine-protein kinase WNK4 isoform X4 [Zea mays]|eukprot:XP_020407174.1 serine/threonine-protein kinase WNK4 isoform X3 [Zea mays]